ncbi:hypothetical protein SAMN05192574_102718 [Mucilaginibacter gossypiicola]|uniref:Uncharacterized protein n=1 Tax=Mucilaginibacter gossypiicola TaxID=551995 RepID=A0A1H8EIJ5_9SPHI|nr:hypothetical protein SAMN05192574_102718 [Mucilaginibacter gossypiicola]
MSLRAQRGNRTEAWPLCIACDCFVVPPRNDMAFLTNIVREIAPLKVDYPTFTASGNLSINPGSGIFFCQVSFSENLLTPG